MDRSVWKDHLHRALGILFPSPCLGCEHLADRGLDGMGLCPRCRGRLRPLVPPLCRTCSKPLGAMPASDDFICLDCRSRRSSIDRLIAVWRYEPPIDAVIRSLKFGGYAPLARPLGRRLAARVREENLVPDCVSHIPLHWRRRLLRGYDQAEELARETARTLETEFVRPLRRRRATRPQSRLTRRERTPNVASAFSARRTDALSGRSVLLVDDVTTSGATLRAGASVLRRLGARKITAAVVARTPEASDSRAHRARHIDAALRRL